MTRRAKWIAGLVIMGVLFPPFLPLLAALVIFVGIAYIFFWACIQFDEMMPSFEGVFE